MRARCAPRPPPQPLTPRPHAEGASPLYLQQFYVDDLAHLSYILAGDESCAIVDPKRDVDDYIRAAQEQGFTITHILETHLHADFVSGHTDLAKRTGAKIYAPRSGGCQFDHVAVADGDTIQIDSLELTVLDTPGHTPDGVCYVVRDTSRGEEPVGVFTGDTLFTGDVGRPDLFPGQAEALASALYDSLHEKVLKLPDFCEVYPAHGAGSLCGRAMSDKRWSTIGYERRYNTALLLGTKDAFMQSLLTGMPAAPDHFARCSDINRRGPTPVDELAEPQALSAEEFNALADRGHVVLDTRGYHLFAETHVPGAYNVGAATVFPTFCGWVLPPDKPILIFPDAPEQAPDLVVLLRRVGFDDVPGYLEGGVAAWAMADFDFGECDVISVEELSSMIQGGAQMQVLDVRTPREFEGGHVPGAANIPFPDTRTRHVELAKDKPVAVLCRTGGRAGIAASILLQHGCQHLAIVAGGITAWQDAGLPTK